MIPPCSEPERQALRSFAATAQETGYSVDTEEFASRMSSEPWLAAFTGLSVVAAMLVYIAPLLAAVVGAAAMVLHARDSDGRPLLRRQSCTAVNVVARAPSGGPPAVVIVAPAEVVPLRLSEKTQRAVTAVLQGGMAAVAAGGAAAWIAEAEAELPALVAGLAAAAGGVVGVCAIVLYASGGPARRRSATLGALSLLARELRDEPVWLLGTGGTRGGMEGIRAFLTTHPDAGDAWWLNLEPAEPGEVCAVSEEGTWRERRAHRFLLGAAEEAGAGVRSYRASPTNATVLLARRRRALTLRMGSLAEGVAIAIATARAALARSARS